MDENSENAVLLMFQKPPFFISLHSCICFELQSLVYNAKWPFPNYYLVHLYCYTYLFQWVAPATHNTWEAAAGNDVGLEQRNIKMGSKNTNGAEEDDYT